MQGQSTVPTEQNQVRHHYVAYVVNKNGQLIELDGCKKGPHLVAENCEDVLTGSIAEIKRKLAAGEISESLSVMTLNALGDL